MMVTDTVLKSQSCVGLSGTFLLWKLTESQIDTTTNTRIPKAEGTL